MLRALSWTFQGLCNGALSVAVTLCFPIQGCAGLVFLLCFAIQGCAALRLLIVFCNSGLRWSVYSYCVLHFRVALVCVFVLCFAIQGCAGLRSLIVFCNSGLRWSAINTQIPARGFFHQSTNVRAQKCMNLSTMHRPASRKQKVRFYYSFWRSTPRVRREGCREQNEIYVSPHFWAIDSTFLARGLRESKQNLRFATVLGDRQHVFRERVVRRQMKFAFRYSFGRSTRRF